MTGSPNYAHWDSTGMFKVAVVGTSYYREQIAAIAQNPPEVHALVTCLAYLVPDNQNSHDRNAVRVVIEGQTVGHLAADYAKIYRSYINELPSHIKHISVAAAITNGLTTRDKKYEYTIELDIPDSLKMHTFNNRMDSGLTRINGYASLEKNADESYVTKVWIPTPEFNELHKTQDVQEWTTETWETINYYALNRQGIGLGLKVYELAKPQYAKLFRDGPTSGTLLLEESRFASLCIKLDCPA